MLLAQSLMKLLWPSVRWVGILVIGTAVLLTGVALLVLPGPAFVVIPMGLGILAIEFEWARRWLRTLKQTAVDTADKVRQRVNGSRPKSDQNPLSTLP